MPDKIRLLPDSVANQIAAGEVIQRPASVIKELVENAVDAGADDIRIFIRDAGRTLIQVIDNGQGMSETDTRMAFERHATSKISSAADLSSLRTMGFRGEALPSICAVASVEVKSKTRNAPIGTRLVISGSKVELQEPDLCDSGTNIMVKNLFFNVPARRKFLKSDSVELANIMREFERLALVNPAVKMSIDTGGKTIELRKGTLLQRISDLWKGSLAEQLIPLEADTPSVKITGFVSRPEFARRRNALQFFLVNGRNMRHPYFRKAVINCFNNLISPDSQPCFFIKFDIDPSAIDVNIHPTKDEIKFEEESVIWSVLTAAVKASLGKNSAIPSIDFESEVLPPVAVTPAAPEPEEDKGFDMDFNPFASTRKPNHPSTPAGGEEKHHHKNPATNWEKLYEGFMKKEEPSVAPQSASSSKPILEAEMATGETLQFDTKYIIASLGEKGVAIIDQHRAHVKILYEQFMERMSRNQPVSQSLLFPELLEVSMEQELVLKEIEPDLRLIGLVISKEGPDYIITGLPPGLSARDAVEIVGRILESVIDDSSHHGEESAQQTLSSVREKIALAMARGMAVKRGRELSADERKEILDDLMALPDPSLTPTGRRVFTLLDRAAIERLLP